MAEYKITFDKTAEGMMGPITMTTPTGRPKAKLKKTRRELGYNIMKYIKRRVSEYGMGPKGALKGYSKAPFKFKKGMKRMWDEDKLVGKTIAGGYAQYRRDVGQQADIFTFKLMGNAWNDWHYEVDDEAGTIMVGFNDPNNAQAAFFAQQDGREDMFDLDDYELAAILGTLIDTFEKEVIDGS